MKAIAFYFFEMFISGVASALFYFNQEIIFFSFLNK